MLLFKKMFDQRRYSV